MWQFRTRFTDTDPKVRFATLRSGDASFAFFQPGFYSRRVGSFTNAVDTHHVHVLLGLGDLFNDGWATFHLTTYSPYHTGGGKANSPTFRVFLNHGSAKDPWYDLVCYDHKTNPGYPHVLHYTPRAEHLPAVDWTRVLELARGCSIKGLGEPLVDCLQELPDPWCALATGDARRFFESVSPVPLGDPQL